MSLQTAEQKPFISDLVDADMVTRRMRVPAKDIVFVKGVIEASQGVCALFAEKHSELTFAAPRSREQELDELLYDLAQELGTVVLRHPAVENQAG